MSEAKHRVTFFAKIIHILKKTFSLIVIRILRRIYKINTSNKLNTTDLALFYNIEWDIQGHNNSITFGKNLHFKNVSVSIYGNNNKVIIGDNVQFNKYGEIWIEDNSTKLSIGNNTTFEGVHIALTENHSEISIGEDCMFANDIDIRTGDSHSIIDTITGKRKNHAGNVVIEDHVWVAPHSSILKGSYISKNSIIASRSLVNDIFKKTETLIGGIPAKELKSNINWDRRRL